MHNEIRDQLLRCVGNGPHFIQYATASLLSVKPNTWPHSRVLKYSNVHHIAKVVYCRYDPLLSLTACGRQESRPNFGSDSFHRYVLCSLGNPV